MGVREATKRGLIALSFYLSSLDTGHAVELGEKLALEFRNLTVQIESEAKLGYGFIVAQRGDTLTIVTADHVVRDGDQGTVYPNIRVELFVDRGHPVTPKVLEQRIPPEEGDLAVLEVQHPDFSMIKFPVAKIPIPRATKAWRIGRDRSWVPDPQTGTYFGRARTIWLRFADLDTPPGSSGGPVLSDQGLVGMVEKQDGRYSWVLPMNTINEFFADNGLPWGLNGDGTSTVGDSSNPRAVLAPLVDLDFGFATSIKCNTLDMNSFCGRAKRLFMEYKTDVDKASGAQIKDARIMSIINDEILMTPLSSSWPILIGGRPPIYFMDILLFKAEADADRYMNGDLTISSNVSWVFAATNRKEEHNDGIFLHYNLKTQALVASYGATPLTAGGTTSDGIIASFEDLPGTTMLIFVRDGMASDAVPLQFHFKDKQGRAIYLQEADFQVRQGLDRGTKVTYYKYRFP
ncbi:hypothetical protein V1283_002689 [Bradyrhizobium sp. AZCC 2262]|uniref:S1 family peptidase n=1 Tax=Bradyrhizobium sp. AZCC 2262 TaxID=3117022 RepID=UPI002FF127DF